MKPLLWICLGGAAGSGARYLLAEWLRSLLGERFPIAGTLAVNLIGCFLLGAIVTVAARSPGHDPTVRLALAVGVMGGFTTYSTFNQETLSFLATGAWKLAAINLLATVLGGLAAGALGMAAARIVVSAPKMLP